MLLLFGLVLGCGRGDTVEGEARGSTLTMLADPMVLNPLWDMDHLLLVFLRLASLDSTGALAPQLAESWIHSDDYRDWTVHLRGDVRWHDGAPVTARDIEFTMKLWNNPDVGHHAAGVVESVTVHDDYSFTVRYRRPQLLSTWWIYYPKHLVEDLDPSRFYDWDFWEHPVGNGPFRVVRYSRGAMVELEANSDFYDGTPAIDRIILRAGGQPLLELLSGNVSWSRVDESRLIPRLREDPRFEVHYGIGPDLYLDSILWNQRHELFRDARVRQALTLALDRRELMQILDQPSDMPLVDGPFTFRQLRRNRLGEPLPYDPDRARSLLEAAGWRDRDGDGTRDRGGKAFSFIALARAQDATSAAVYVQQQLRRVGIRMEIAQRSGGLFNQLVRAGEFEAAFARIRNSLVEGDNLLHYFRDPTRLGYESARLHELLDKAQRTADPDETDRLFSEMQALMQVDMPVTVLGVQADYIVVDRSVQGLSSPLWDFPAAYVRDLRIEKQR